MPKKAHGRPAKSKQRSRRPQQRPIEAAAEPVAPAVPSIPTAAVAAAPAAGPAAAPRASTRRPSSARRAPTLALNYHYLRHDIMTLGLLGPAMIVLLIIAYIFLH